MSSGERRSRSTKTLFFAAGSIAATVLMVTSASARSRPKGDDETTAVPAAEAPPKVVVVHVEGDDAAAIAREISGMAPSQASAVGDKQIGEALAKKKAKFPLGRALDGDATRVAIFDKVRAAAKETGADAVLIVRVRKDKAGRKAEIWVIDIVHPAVTYAGQTALAPKRSSDEDSRLLEAPIGEAFAKAAPPPPPRPPPKAKPAEPNEEHVDAKDEHEREHDDDDDAPKKKKTPKKHGVRDPDDVDAAMLVARLAPELAWRDFSYGDGTSPKLRPYSVGRTPVISAAIELYPLADSSSAALRAIGIVGSFGNSIGLQSQFADGTQLATTFRTWDAGVRVRIRTGDARDPTIGVSVKYGDTSFTFAEAGAVDDELPSVDYRYVRIGADLRVPFQGWSIFLGLGYRLISSAGDVASRYTSASETGFDASGGVMIDLTRALHVDVHAHYERYGYSLTPTGVDGDPDATSASDAFYGVGAAIVLTL